MANSLSSQPNITAMGARVHPYLATLFTFFNDFWLFGAAQRMTQRMKKAGLPPPAVSLLVPHLHERNHPHDSTG